MDRRSQERCPVCQGPTQMSKEKSGEIRCRNSCCLFNHPGLTCEVCSSQSIAVSYKDDAYIYSCIDCGKKWDREDAK